MSGDSQDHRRAGSGLEAAGRAYRSLRHRGPVPQWRPSPWRVPNLPRPSMTVAMVAGALVAVFGLALFLGRGAAPGGGSTTGPEVSKTDPERVRGPQSAPEAGSGVRALASEVSPGALSEEVSRQSPAAVKSPSPAPATGVALASPDRLQPADSLPPGVERGTTQRRELRPAPPSRLSPGTVQLSQSSFRLRIPTRPTSRWSPGAPPDADDFASTPGAGRD